MSFDTIRGFQTAPVCPFHLPFSCGNTFHLLYYLSLLPVRPCRACPRYFDQIDDFSGQLMRS